MMCALLGTLCGGTAGAADDPEARARAFEELQRFQNPPTGEGLRPVPAGGRDPLERRHLGFYFRPDLGVGYMAMTEPTQFGDLTISGPAGVFGLHVGGALQENIILGVHLYDAVMQNPTVSLGGQSRTANGSQAGLFAIGPELTVYFAPANVYVSATLALSRVTADVNGQSVSTEAGVASRVSLGKEWWVSSHWGLGLVGHLDLSRNQDGGSGAPMMQTVAGSLAFSATYN
jgi:hypothetical protein